MYDLNTTHSKVFKSMLR